MPRPRRPPLDALGESARRTFMRELRVLAKGAESEEDLNRITEAALAAFEEAIPVTLQQSAQEIADAMDAATARAVRALRRDERGFQNRLHERWGAALDRLRALVQAFYEFGAKFHQDSAHPDAEPLNALTEALTQLQARACRTAREVLHLLEGGFSDGALARWRTLHGVTVVAAFLKQHGPTSAERYLLHDVVRALRSAELLAEHTAVLGWEPLPESEIDVLREERDRLCQRFGASFGTEYGWAADVLRSGNPGIRHIEEAVDLSVWRPFYRWASDGVHAGPGGLRPLGLHPEAVPMLLTGPSNVGLADPGQNTALALSLFVTVLTTHRPTMDTLAMCFSFQELSSRCIDAFVTASEIMDRVVAEELKEHGMDDQG